MRVWVEPPKGPRGGRARDLKAHAREVTTGAQIDELVELRRRGFTFRVDEIAVGRNVDPLEIASTLRLGSTPREAQLNQYRYNVLESIDVALGFLHEDEREYWMEQLIQSLGQRKDRL